MCVCACVYTYVYIPSLVAMLQKALAKRESVRKRESDCTSLGECIYACVCVCVYIYICIYQVARSNVLEGPSLRAKACTKKKVSAPLLASVCVCVSCNNTLQHTATYCNTWPDLHIHSAVQSTIRYTILSTLQHTATLCNILQHMTYHRHTQRCITLQHPATTHCNTLQHTAPHDPPYIYTALCNL